MMQSLLAIRRAYAPPAQRAPPVPLRCETKMSVNHRPVRLANDAYGATKGERLLRLSPSQPCSASALSSNPSAS
jgi:hypothetical protein